MKKGLKKFLLVLGMIIFAPIWLLIILGHFITYPIVQKKRKKHKIENKYWNERVYNSDRCQVFLTTSHDLMVSFNHYYDDLTYDDDERKYAREVSIHFGGIHVFWKWGHKFLDKTKWSDDSKTKYYGLYCIDGWHGGYDCLWWGKLGLMDLPWRRCKWVGTYVWDKNMNELVNTDKLDELSKKLPIGFPKYPPVRVDYDTTYINKNNEKQNVPKITWTLIERRYESPLLRWIGLGKLFQKKYVELEFDCDNNGNKEFDGLGVNANSSWKGGVYSSGIKITKNSERQLYSLYKSVVEYDKMNNFSKFINKLNERINKFMTEDKLY